MKGSVRGGTTDFDEMVLYRWGFRRGGKTRKHRKVGVKRKWWVLSKLPYSPKGNGRKSTRWNHGTNEIDHMTRRRTQGAGIVKSREDKRDRERLPDTFT